MIVWIIGLPNAGKTAVALLLKEHLLQSGLPTVLLDGDDIRRVLAMEQSHYDRGSRVENALRIGRLAALLANQGITVIVAANTLLHEVQQRHRAELPGYVEVYLDCDEATRRQRDGEKQLYERFDRGETCQVLGLDIPADEPDAPDLRVPVSHGELSAAGAAEMIHRFLRQMTGEGQFEERVND